MRQLCVAAELSRRLRVEYLAHRALSGGYRHDAAGKRGPPRSSSVP